MQKRRFGTIKGNIDLYLFLVVIAGLFHIYIPEASQKPVFFYTAGLSYLLLIYIGYKFGKTWGAIAGLVSAGYWFVLLLFYGELPASSLLTEGRYEGVVFGEKSILSDTVVLYASFQHVLILAAIGYMAGWVMDIIENVLSRHDLALEDVLPRHNDIYLKHIGAWLERVIRAVFLLQVESTERKALILSRLRKLFVIIVILPLLYYFNLLSFWVHWDAFEYLSIYLPPLAPVIILWIAYAFGPRQGVLAALALLLSPIVIDSAQAIADEFSLRVSIGVSSPSNVVALAVSAWVIGAVGVAMKEPHVSERLGDMFGFNEREKVLPIKLWHILLLVLAMFSIDYRTDSYTIYWDNYGLLLLISVLSGLLFNLRQASNAILLIVGVGVLLHVSFWLDGFNLGLNYGRIKFDELVFLALIPLIVSMFHVETLNNIRLLVAIILGLAWIAKMVIDAGVSVVSPDYFLRLTLSGAKLPMLSILMTILFSELGARVIWAIFRRYRTD